MAAPFNQLLWSLIGLFLTIGATFIELYVTSTPWNWHSNGVQTLSVGVTYQIAAVLLIGCLSGRNAASLSQVAYLILGLSGLPIFTQGGGLTYLKQPFFGYLLGFVPGAWVCGFLAFLAPAKLETLAFSCICGLITIHVTGLGYLFLSHTFGWITPDTTPLFANILKYSFYPLPGQLIVVCAAAVIAYLLRQLMFY